MTVKYECNFLCSLLRWKGSVWKVVWQNLMVWLFLFALVRIILLIVVPKDVLAYLERGARSMGEVYPKILPVEFMLGFFVAQTVKRWWSQVENVPWPDDLICTLNGYFFKNDAEDRDVRRTLTRYSILSIILALRQVSTHLQKKIPDYQTLIDCELLTKTERQLISINYDSGSDWAAPLQWIMKLVRKKVGLHADNIPPVAIIGISSEISRLRRNIRSLVTHDSIPLPLVYTQTVTAAVYGYFAMCLFSRQFDLKCNSTTDHFCSLGIYFNVAATVLQFVFYVGWLKVAEVLHKPFGDDEDDMELSSWIKRHISAACSLSDSVDDQMTTDNSCIQTRDSKIFDKWTSMLDSNGSKENVIEIENGTKEKLAKYVHKVIEKFRK